MRAVSYRSGVSSINMTRLSKRNRRVQWPCSTCGQECEDNTVFCDGCMVWFHAACDKLSSSDLKAVGQTEEEYRCSSCTEIAGSSGALERLKNYTGPIARRLKLEVIFLKRIPFHPVKSLIGVADDAREDKVSSSLLSNAGGVHGRMPIRVTGDGNCLFNALSIVISGDESAAADLRLRTCIEMVRNKQFYLDCHQHSGIALVSPNYQEACEMCSVEGGYSSAWTMHAAATVLGVEVQSVYPPVNGLLDKCIAILNTTFQPRRKSTTRERVVIMWTSCMAPTSGKTWSPNHFVPLLPIPSMTVDLESEDRSYADVVKSPPSSNTMHSKRQKPKPGVHDTESVRGPVQDTKSVPGPEVVSSPQHSRDSGVMHSKRQKPKPGVHDTESVRGPVQDTKSVPGPEVVSSPQHSRDSGVMHSKRQKPKPGVQDTESVRGPVQDTKSVPGPEVVSSPQHSRDSGVMHSKRQKPKPGVQDTKSVPGPEVVSSPQHSRDSGVMHSKRQKPKPGVQDTESVRGPVQDTESVPGPEVVSSPQHSRDSGVVPQEDMDRTAQTVTANNDIFSTPGPAMNEEFLQEDMDRTAQTVTPNEVIFSAPEPAMNEETENVSTADNFFLDETYIIEHVTSTPASPVSTEGTTWGHLGSPAMSSSPITNEDSISEVQKPIPEGAIRSNGCFLGPDDVYQVMSNREPSANEVPPGTKENVFFLLNYEDNVSRQYKHQKSQHIDDCGPWGSTSGKTHHYIFENGKLKYVDYKNGTYFRNVKRARVQMDPQPDEEDLITFRRYYLSLKRDKDYRKRISTVTRCPDGLCYLKELAVVEYTGKFPESIAVHGNAKKTSIDYVRTTARTKRKLDELVTHKMPREVYQDMLLDGSDCAPRDLKQVQNTKYAKQRTIGEPKRNAADDMQQLLNQFHEHPFIQEIIQTKAKNPSVILYLDDSLKDIRQFCSSKSAHPCVLGVDRTFNLGACYVTILVYQHRNLYRKLTDNSPLMLGAAYLHWDGSYETYHRFFSHIQSKFRGATCGTQLGNIVIGSDEEIAMTQAIKDCFPSSHHILCSRHLEENTRRHLAKKVGADANTQRQILKEIFTSGGLIQSTTMETFDLKFNELLDQYSLTQPRFVDYFRKIGRRIRDSVVQPRLGKEWIPLDWKNNACESINNILKLSTNWKSLRLPDLIDRIYRIVQVQQLDVRRALHGQGNYELAQWMRKLYVRPTVWAEKTEEEKDEIYRKLMMGKQPKPSNVVSSDGLLTLPTTPKSARKPGQRKRIKCSKTVTSKCLF